MAVHSAMGPPGTLIALDGIGRAAYQFAPYIFSALVVAFLAATGVAVFYRDRRRVREGYGVFVTIVLVLSLVAPTFPFSGYLLFSDADPPVDTYHEMRVTDSDGDVIRYDTRALLDRFTGNQIDYLPRALAEGELCTSPEAQQVAQHLIDRSQEYYHRVNGSGDLEGVLPLWTIDFVDYPRHNLDYRWTESALREREMGVPRTLRILNVTVRTEDDGTAIRSITSDRRVEFTETATGIETTSFTRPARCG